MDFHSRLLATLRAVQPVLQERGVLVVGSEVPNLLEHAAASTPCSRVDRACALCRRSSGGRLRRFRAPTGPPGRFDEHLTSTAPILEPAASEAGDSVGGSEAENPKQKRPPEPGSRFDAKGGIRTPTVFPPLEPESAIPSCLARFCARVPQVRLRKNPPSALPAPPQANLAYEKTAKLESEREPDTSRLR